MIFSFLTKDDILGSIKESHLEQVIGNNDGLIRAKEKSAVDWMKSYLSNRYDMPDCFPAISQWSAAKTYKAAIELTVTVRDEPYTYTPKYYRDANGYIINYAYHNGKFYKAIADSTNVEPRVSANWEDSWEEQDPREEVLVEYCIHATIFKLFARVTPRKIPQIRIDMYNLAKEWVEGVKDEELNPELPLPIFPDETIDEIQWGSNAQNSYYW